MADNDILIPGEGGLNTCDNTEPQADETQYLQKDNYLGEFETTEDKEIARANLGVPSKDEVYNKTEVSNEASKIVQEAMQTHLNSDDPHSILPQVNDLIKGMVKDDGSVAFTSPQAGVDPILSFHLTTKSFVESLLNSHTTASDPHNIMSLVNEALTEYVKASQVYLRDEVYNKSETSKLFNGYIKDDGSVSFKRPQLGIDPTSDGHLTTKRYVDNLIQKHLVEVDPHGFISTLNTRLSAYYKKTDTYSKAETYSRTQLNAIVASLVKDAAQSVIEEHINSSDPHGTLKAVENEHYVKRDGTVAFTAPQKGVPGLTDNDFVTLSQVKSLINNQEGEDSENGECSGWTTSGPVQTTVGFIEDNSELPEHLTCQQVFDMIFYGKEISVTSPPYSAMGSTVNVEMAIHGSLADIQSIELYQGSDLVGTYTAEQFNNGYYIETSLPLSDNPTTFTFRVCYMNGTCLEAESITKIGYYAYIGLLPEWYTGANVSYEYLESLVNSDPTNNIKLATEDTIITHIYNFSSPSDPKHIFVMIPKSDDKTLYQMTMPSQQFSIDAFDILADIPIVYPDGQTVVYTMYIYKEALIGLSNVEITFKFSSN